jgi:AraC-like DNA-binding protein
MLNKPTTLAITLAPLKEALQSYGVDFGALAREAGLDVELLARPNARFPAARIQRLWGLAVARVGDPLFGIRVGEQARPGIFHAVGLGIVSSTTLVKALQRIERYSNVVSTNGRIALVQQDPYVSLESRPTETMLMPSPETMEALVVALCRILRQCAGPAAIPVKVRLKHQSAAPVEAFREALGCPVEFNAPNIALVFDAKAAAQPLLSGNPELAAEADRLAARYLEGMIPDSASARVRSLLMKAMPAGDFDQDGIARALNQSTSTLQRRLRDEGTSYQQLLDTTRRDLALEYLKDARHSLADIAFLLGFTDQSNFTRAFRRWTGKTPTQFMT